MNKRSGHFPIVIMIKELEDIKPSHDGRLRLNVTLRG